MPDCNQPAKRMPLCADAKTQLSPSMTNIAATVRLDPDDAQAIRRFIAANTVQVAPPLVPEIQLHLAAESLAIWQKTEDELGELNVPPPFWAFAWAGGQALARYLLDNPNLVAHKRVVDLGSGSGLTAIAAMLCSASAVTAADIDRLALIATLMNAEAASVCVTTTADNLLARPVGAFDVLLVGDLFYERQLATDVLAYITAAAGAGAVCLIGDPRRNYFPHGRFTEVARYNVPVTRDLEDSEFKSTAVWRLG
jgi:predicted nicotinamide N-methyase